MQAAKHNVRKAKSGGPSRIVSAAAIHNEVLRRRPDLIDVFYADWYNSRQGDEQPGEARASQEYPEIPRLTKAQHEALELFGVLSDELALDMAFEPGDIQLLDNLLIYHARTRYDDYRSDAVTKTSTESQKPDTAGTRITIHKSRFTPLFGGDK